MTTPEKIEALIAKYEKKLASCRADILNLSALGMPQSISAATFRSETEALIAEHETILAAFAFNAKLRKDLAGHPCFVDQDCDLDHDLKYVDDSFSHEFGTEVRGHWECKNCGTVVDLPHGYYEED
jgi:hypothetical protein